MMRYSRAREVRASCFSESANSRHIGDATFCFHTFARTDAMTPHCMTTTTHKTRVSEMRFSPSRSAQHQATAGSRRDAPIEHRFGGGPQQSG